MPQKSLGGLRLFKLFGISVYLHWSWFIAPILAYRLRQNETESAVWSIGLCLALFAMVLLHEFGHALACRSVGGRADRIVLWPLGGLAFVQPPPRPGALLWSIAAGPLVNVVLAVVIGAAYLLSAGASAQFREFIVWAFGANALLLVFNLLPVYPLDGGQIVRALLWFVVGRESSLLVSGVIGLVVAAVGALFAAIFHEWWLFVIALFGGIQSWAALGQAKALGQLAAAPRYMGMACPRCRAAPPAGPFWKCHCGQMFDTFQHAAVCPRCGQAHAVTACADCGNKAPLASWQAPLPLPPIA